MPICSAHSVAARGCSEVGLHFSGKLMPGAKLSRHETEPVILRVAHLRGCQYISTTAG